MRIWKHFDPKTVKIRWSGDGTVNGRRLRPRNLTTKAEVEAVFDVARARKHQRRYDLPEERAVIRLSELVAERVRDLDLRRHNHRQIKAWLEAFRDNLPGDPEVESLTTADVISYKRLRLRRVSPNTLNTELVRIGQMLRRAGDYFPSLARWKPPRIPYEPVPQHGRERVVTPDEAAALLAELRAPRRIDEGESEATWRNRLTAADFWEISPYVGMRTTELRLLEKSWVDLREALLRLPKHVTKGGRAREVPLSDEALAVVRRRMLSSPHPRYLFPGATGANVIHQSVLYEVLRRAAARAGLAYGQRAVGGFRPHDNRHTFVTDMLQSGADAATVGSIVGHSTRYMTLIYSHATNESKRRAVRNLSRARGRVAKKSTEASGSGSKS